jgi:Na+-driven multidrug efflux pump
MNLGFARTQKKEKEKKLRQVASTFVFTMLISILLMSLVLCCGGICLRLFQTLE